MHKFQVRSILLKLLQTVNRADVPLQEHSCLSVVTTNEVCSQQDIATCTNCDWTHAYWDPMPNTTAN